MLIDDSYDKIDNFRLLVLYMYAMCSFRECTIVKFEVIYFHSIFTILSFVFTLPRSLFVTDIIVQIADAVIVARNLGATLVIPDIRGSQPGDKRFVLLTIKMENINGYGFSYSYSFES